MDHDEHVLKEVENGLGGDYSDRAQEVTFLIFGLIATAANVLLIYTICYFKILHTNTNVYLINWALSDIGSSLMGICCFEIFINVFHVPDKVLFFSMDAQNAFGTGTIIFMFLFTVDWCLSAYFSRLLDKFRKYTEIIVAAVWISMAVYLIIVAAQRSLSDNAYIITLVIFVAFSIFVVVLHCTRLVHKCKGKFEYYPVSQLLIPTAYVICCIWSWIHLFLFLAFDIYIPVVSWFSDTPAYVHAIINLILMVVLDKEFKTCFFKTIESASCEIFKSPSQNGQENLANTDA